MATRWISSWWLALALAASLAAPAAGQETPTPGGRVLDSLISEPDSLDPARANLLVSQYVLGLVYDRLVYASAPTAGPSPGSPSRGRWTGTGGR